MLFSLLLAIMQSVLMRTKNSRKQHCNLSLGFLICQLTIKGSTANIENANWMARLATTLQEEPLSSIAIPGSHDSASYSLNGTNDLAPDLPPKVASAMKLSKALNGSEKYLRGEIYRWSVTQRLNITQQLELGIRYFDLRVFYRQNQDTLYTYHGLTGAPLKSLLLQMVTFQRRHPLEVLLLDFNHLERSTTKLTNLLKATFGDKIFSNKSTQISLSNLWREGKNIIVFFRSLDKDSSVEPPELAFSGKNLISPFDKRKFYSIKTWLAFIEYWYSHRPTNRTFYVTQGIMQPSILGIGAAGLFGTGSLEKWVADDATSNLVIWLRQCKRGADGINIVIADFVESYNFTDTVLSLNIISSSSCLSNDSLLEYFSMAFTFMIIFFK